MDRTRLTTAARIVFLASPFLLVGLMPWHELLGAIHPALGVWDEVVLLAMAVAWCLLRRQGLTGSSRVEWLTVAVAAFWVVCIVSSLENSVPDPTWLGQARKLLPYTALCLMVANAGALMGARWRRSLIIFLVSVGSLAVLWGVVSCVLFFRVGFDEGGVLSGSSEVWRVLLHPYTRRLEMDRLERAVGSFLDPNVFGSYVVVIVALACGLLLAARHWSLRATLSLVICIGVVGVALTNSRGSMLGLTTAVVVIGALKNWRLCLVPLGLALVVALLTPRGVTSERVTRIRPVDVERIQQPLRDWEEIQEGPALGKGLGARGYSDMQYATLLYETGAVGLVCFALVLGVSLTVCLLAFRRATDSFDQCLYAAVAGLCLAAVMQSFAADYFLAPQRACFFWLLMGLAARSCRDAPALLPPLEEEEA